MGIYQDLVDAHGFTAKYASVTRFVATLRGATPTEARVVITTAAGEEGHVDYGEGPLVRWPATGQYRRTRLFLFTLACSRKAVRLLTWRSSAQIWCELHERAFRRLGGTTKVIVLDNLKEGVLTPDIYDPALNPLYRDMLAHYGVVALPCRVGDPDRKGKVESSIGHTQKTPLHGQRFETIDLAQTYLDRWDAHWADTRIHGTTKRQVAEMFAEERPALGPLPIEPFRYYQSYVPLDSRSHINDGAQPRAARVDLRDFAFPFARLVGCSALLDRVLPPVSRVTRSARYTFSNDWYGTSRLFAKIFKSESSAVGSRSEMVSVDALRFGNTTWRAVGQSTSWLASWVSQYSRSARSEVNAGTALSVGRLAIFPPLPPTHGPHRNHAQQRTPDGEHHR
jgi:transposase